MKKTIIAICSVLVIMSLIALGYSIYQFKHSFDPDETETINWIVKETGINVPEKSVLLEFYAGMEYGELMKYRLAENDVVHFLNDYNFKFISVKEATTVFITAIEPDWESERFRHPDSFYLLEDCKKGVIWKLLLNKTDRLLWFEVIHADWGGDLPECNKEQNVR